MGDVLAGGAGDDTLTGAEGRDTLYGDSGWVASDGGDDRLLGGADDDFILAGPGLDSVFGGSGDDTLYGYTFQPDIALPDGADLLDGGPGSDCAVFTGVAADYTLTRLDALTVQILDTRGIEGTDLLVDIEFAVFIGGGATTGLDLALILQRLAVPPGAFNQGEGLGLRADQPAAAAVFRRVDSSV
jgi:Ca2+-binding RTX toxin-like protein